MAKTANLGIAPAVVVVIVQTAVTLIQMGISYYSATQQAIKQQRMQRYLEEEEISQIAEGLARQFPNATYDEWKDFVRMANMSANQDGPPPDEKDWKQYIPYVAVGGLILILVVRR